MSVCGCVFGFVLASTAVFGCGGVQGQPDAGAMVMPMVVPCSDQPVCDGAIVRACVDGVGANMLEACTDGTTCSAGRCMTAACVDASSNHRSFTGCFFYTAHAPNVASDAAHPTSFLITNPGTSEASVSLKFIDGGGKWATIASVVAPAGKSARLSIAEGQVTGIGVSPGAALMLESKAPVTVAQIESDDRDEDALSTSGTMLLPVHVLGPHYKVLAYPQRATPDVGAVSGSAGGAARLLIVGTRPDTLVQFTAGPNGAVVAGPDGEVLAAGAVKSIPIGEGDVVQLSSASEQDDLSGSEIWANLPVAVFSGNVSTTYGIAVAGGITSPDMVHEQIPPIGSWSYHYVAAALPPQADTCDTLLGTRDASLWRMLAAYDGTTVKFARPADTIGLPAGPVTLQGGQVLELVVLGDFSVEADKPLLLAQGMDCEPTLALAVSADRWLTDLPFAVLPNFDQVIAVVRLRGTTVVLDDVPIDEARFVSVGPAPGGGEYQIARVPIASCPSRTMVCTHRLTGRFGMTLRGMDVLSSYALTAPMWLGCIDHLDPTCVP